MSAKSNKSTATATTAFDTDTDGLIPVATYVGSDRKSRAAIRSITDGAMKAALTDGNMVGAVAAMNRLAEFKSAAGTVTATETDWSQLVANRVATFAHIAATYVPELPDGVTVDMDALPVGEVDTDMVTRITGMPLRRSAKSNDVGALIVAAFVGKPINTRLSVADVVRHAATNGSTVSNGAVTARATADKWTGHAGIVPVKSDANGPTGFVNKSVIADDDTDA